MRANKLNWQWPIWCAIAMIAVIFACLYLYNVAMAFSHSRFVFNFPRWIFQAVSDPFYFDRHRFGFLFFQLPNILNSLINGTNPTYESFNANARALNFMLQMHAPLALFYVSIAALKLKKHAFLLTFLVSFSVLYLPAAATSFNGSPQGHSFFWVLAWLTYSKALSNKRVATIYYVLWSIFMTLYPPFAFVGALALAYGHYKNTLRFDRHTVTHLTGALVLAIYLLIIRFSPKLYNFGETYQALELTGLDWLLKMIIPMLVIVILVLSPKPIAQRRLWIMTLLASLSLYLYFLIGYSVDENWYFASAPIYFRRIYVYTFGPLLFVLVSSYSWQHKNFQTNRTPFMLQLSYLVVLCLFGCGLYIDFQSRIKHWQHINVAAKAAIANENRCINASDILDVDLYNHYSFHYRDWPFYSLMFPELFKGKLIYFQQVENLSGWSLQNVRYDSINRYCQWRERDDEKSIPIAYRFFDY